ncbi:class I SAM-dependent DNA methyltransferase [Crossiella cryophila]|uniref:SAM-dependent methyltransferase n=1 Tax=Crossiella cryophila TaxID=43355 RepID=A0A7W7C7S9_9PSEU|nr:class I SAM-dependent methyltransferase [Crossiella cryophila]MBB4676122.1 SAM-dependent methyltransferase [Crossiella cryophila]
MYGAAYAEIYDLIYASRDKDYAGESAELAALVRARKPDAASLLDVACGTGGHLAHLKQEFGTVAGLEQSEHMIARANRAMPDIPVYQGDMRDFHVERTFDAVVCMFSSIGYVGSTAALDSTLKSFAHHLNPGGVIIIEPWYFPDGFLPGYIANDLVRTPDRVTVRVSHSTREGDQVPMTVHYIDAQRDAGIKHYTDVHWMTLFEREQYEAAFEQAGCRVEYLPGGRFNCGLFVGTRTDQPLR